MRNKLLLIIIMVVTFVTTAHANTINEISMDIYIDKYGDAHVKETWDVYVDNSTEIFHQYLNIGDSQITDFKVSDSTYKDYSLVNWNVDASFDAKSYKYGYNYVDNGVELCLGISHYGDYKYYLTYTIKGFVYNLSDAQIAYWRLIPELNSGLESYYIKIYADEAFSNKLPVWGFGKKGDYTYVYDGYVEMESNDRLSSDEYATILIKFDKGTFITDYNLDYSFDQILAMAKEGSSPFEDKIAWWEVLLIILSFVFVPFVIIFALIKSGMFHSGKLYKKIIPKKDIPIFRDFPCKDDMFKAYFIAVEYELAQNKTNFLGTMILKWLKDGMITITTEQKGMFKNNRTKIIMSKPANEIIFTNTLEAKMYEMMYTASEDGILEQNEFNKYCRKHYSKVLNWFDDCINDEYSKIKNTDLVQKDEKHHKRYNATEKLNEIGLQMAGLKKFYKEFGSIGDKSSIEVKLWREHLMYAQIFGVAKEVAKEFKALYPTEILDEDVNTVILVNNFSHSSMSTATSARSRAESYSSGGGGFSSGGGGGGSFGGGSSGGFR